MIVLHAIWSIPDGLRVWGETTGGSAAPVAAGHAAERVRVHPFACEASALEDALGGEVPEARLCGLLLPSSHSAPLSSRNDAGRRDRAFQQRQSLFLPAQDRGPL